ncbi:hypothetical protein F2Q68_00006788 [Brassica cretica]|uniref:Uncharacterized protein n=1 Tax=Brassica cretica TaxID=69181 RepID=A0A8S9JCL3_BRACR|nr:hypothetical protein F2Q68_00006788 [Brassica cretica]
MWSTRWNGQALGVAMHATKACGQPCVRWCVDLHALQSCSWPSVRGCVILHETETCSQPCGARGVAAHASGAMRSDTRAAARLVPDCTWRRFCSSEERSVLVETSSRPIWTWVYLRRSRKGSDRRSRVWGQGHGQPKNLNAECLDDIAKLWIVSTWRRFCSSEERSVLVETSSRPVWTWVYLRRSRKGSDRRSRVWGQGHGQPKTVSYNQLIAELFSCRIPLLGSWIMAGGRV